MTAKYSLKLPKNYSGYTKLTDPTGVKEFTFAKEEFELFTPALMGEFPISQAKLDLKLYTPFKEEIVPKEIDPTCVLWLPFGEGEGNTASDISGKENHGTIDGAVWRKINRIWVLSFDGEDDYIGVPHSTSLNVRHITAELWVKKAPGTFYTTLIGKPYYYIAPWGIKITRTAISVNIYVGGVRYEMYLSGALIPPAEEWFHLVQTYNGEIIRGYINAALAGENTAPSGDLDTTTANVIAGEFFPGLIGGIRIYNRALSAEEIAEHFEVERGLYGV